MSSSCVEADNSAGSRHRNLRLHARTEFVTEKNADPGGTWGGSQVMVWTLGNFPRLASDQVFLLLIIRNWRKYCASRHLRCFLRSCGAYQAAKFF